MDLGTLKSLDNMMCSADDNKYSPADLMQLDHSYLDCIDLSHLIQCWKDHGWGQTTQDRGKMATHQMGIAVFGDYIMLYGRSVPLVRPLFQNSAGYP